MQSEKLSKSTKPTLRECQKLCLLHVFRNFAVALNGAIYTIENSHETLDANKLVACISNLPTNLQRVIDTLKAGSFCPLTDAECNFVSRFVGCDGVKSVRVSNIASQEFRSFK